ncbi:unnamed protein product [Owenia fusiformis]|uniref:Ankyrin repeat domain-containing protein n=1 Tax=Owenia fusiformis TaxID=6347 RepID=A0A8J1TLL3_OWEFU|nr:unnamed protein product [Owenia fusiformis]
MSSKSLQAEFPVHWLVWHNDYEELDKLLQAGEINKEKLDPRGRTALHLAVTLGNLESARVLMRHGCDANRENTKNWTALQEAIATGDPELVQLVLQYRDYQRYTRRAEGVPGLLQKLREASDFYVEMKWEFTSWVPLVSRMCPSDTYKVWKSGANVRIDTTLLGFDNMNWQRGSRSFIFRGQVNSAVAMEVDHDASVVYTETMQVLPGPVDPNLLRPHEDAVAARLTTPLVTTYVDTDKISFERNKTGIWGWRSEKSETVNGYNCKVFNATNVELVTKTRTEHMTEQDKKKNPAQARNPLESFLGFAEKEEKVQGANNGEILEHERLYNPSHITPEEYFNDRIELGDRDIGRPIEQSTKIQKFKANLSLCEDYPLSLQEQVIPIIDLMATSNAHFAKLRDFITLTLPAGFPVKIEIPLFHVLNAKITFGNIFARDSPIEGVTIVEDGDISTCIVEDNIFEAPASFSRIGESEASVTHRHERVRDEDDELLQFAIQQSLLEAGTEDDKVTFWEALNKSRPNGVPGGEGPQSLPRSLQTEEERQLQRAIEASLGMDSQNPPANGPLSDIKEPSICTQPPAILSDAAQLRLAMELSQREDAERERRRKQEEEELAQILQLSLTEK